MMNRALIVAIREVRTFLQDKAELAFSLLLPIAIFALMYGAFSGQSTFRGTAHIVNEDPGGTHSTSFLERVAEFENLDVEILARDDADSKLDRSDLVMVFYIPENFSEKLSAGESTQLSLKQRGNGGQEGQIVASLVRGVAEEMAQEFQVKNQVRTALAETDIPQERIEITVQQFIDQEKQNPAVAVREDTVGSRTDPVNLFLPGIVTMFVLFAVTMSARAIVEERKKGTLERLLTTKLSVGQLFMGKYLASVLRGFVQTFILLVLAYIVFQLFTPLSFLETLVVALVFSAAGSALGLFIASIARSEDQSTWIAVFFTMAMVMLGGTFFEAPEGSVFYLISKASINTYANDAFRTIMVDGGSLSDTVLELVVMAGVSVAGLLLSRTLFRAIPGGR